MPTKRRPASRLARPRLTPVRVAFSMTQTKEPAGERRAGELCRGPLPQCPRAEHRMMSRLVVRDEMRRGV